MNECHFELKDLRCAECGRLTGNQGTCEDVDYCPKCRADYENLTGRPSAQLVVSAIEGHKYYPRSRAIHLFSNGKTLCGRRGNHNTTSETEKVTCKKCRHAASVIGIAGI